MYLEVFKTFIFVSYGKNWSSDCMAMRTMILRCQDGVPPKNVTPNEKSRTFRLLDNASLGHVVPDQCVLTLGCIKVFVKISYYVFWHEHARKFVTRWLRKRENWLLVGLSCAKLVTHWLCMSENWLLVGWASTKIGYSLAEHALKLITRWLSMRENWLLVDWVWTKIG